MEVAAGTQESSAGKAVRPESTPGKVGLDGIPKAEVVGFAEHAACPESTAGNADRAADAKTQVVGELNKRQKAQKEVHRDGRAKREVVGSAEHADRVADAETQVVEKVNKRQKAQKKVHRGGKAKREEVGSAEHAACSESTAGNGDRAADAETQVVERTNKRQKVQKEILGGSVRFSLEAGALRLTIDRFTWPSSYCLNKKLAQHIVNRWPKLRSRFPDTAGPRIAARREGRGLASAIVGLRACTGSCHISARTQGGAFLLALSPAQNSGKCGSEGDDGAAEGPTYDAVFACMITIMDALSQGVNYTWWALKVNPDDVIFELPCERGGDLEACSRSLQKLAYEIARLKHSFK